MGVQGKGQRSKQGGDVATRNKPLCGVEGTRWRACVSDSDVRVVYREPAAVSMSPATLGYFLTDSFGPRADYKPSVPLSYLLCCRCTRSVFDTPAALFVCFSHFLANF